MSSHSPAHCVFLTGATGFLGHYVLAQLLRTGRECVALVRSPMDESAQRLARLLGEVGVDVETALQNKRLRLVEGELDGCLPHLSDVVGNVTVLHIAASTRFDADATGEPARTNIDGTRHLLGWACRHNVKSFHLVSSAYVCGASTGVVEETFSPAPPAFHNAYEQSKWEAERLCHAWSRTGGAALTVYRPSIIVGDSVTGRASKFDGFYRGARGAEALGRLYEPNDPRRHTLPLRLRGHGSDEQNIVPVDYVATLIAAAVNDARWWGRTYHLVHPAAPTNDEVTRSCNTQFNIAGGHWIPPAAFDRLKANLHERLFLRVSHPIRHYLSDTPRFTRRNTAELEESLGLAPPVMDSARLAQLLDFAQAANFGDRESAGDEAGRASSRDCCRQYFEEFLPYHVPRSRIASMAALSTTIRFDIKDIADGQWVCRFDAGRLAEVHRGPNTLHEEFGYRLRRDVFLRAVAGDVHPQNAFFSGEIDVFGDVERALKMAMILHEFNQEFPFRKEAVACA